MSAPVRSAAPVKPPAPSRMTLGAITKGKTQQPTRVIIYGTEGVGKSTFAANAPSPIFLGAEDGTGQLDVARLPQPNSFEEALDAVRLLTDETHEYATLVVDTVDWFEPLVWGHICRRDGEANIESYGFGKGYNVAIDEWRRFLAALQRLQRAKSMHVVLVAHSWVKSFKNPQGDDFDRYELKLNAKAGGLLKEWADAVLFAQYETYAKKDGVTKRVRGVSTGARILMTERTAAYDAKNRYSLPEQMPLSWADFWAGVQAGQVASPTALREEILRKAADLPEETAAKVRETVEKYAGNSMQLAQINNRVNALLHEQGTTTTPKTEATAS